MPITRELASEIRVLFKDFIEDFLKSEQFLKHISDTLTKNFNEKLDHMLDVQFLKHISDTLTKNFNEKLDHMLDVYGKKVTELEAVNKTLSSKIDDIEQYSRRSNIRIVGLPEEVSENTMDKVLTFCSEKLDLKLGSNDIDRCHRVGKPINGHRALLIKFVGYNIKREIFKRRAALKNTRILIAEDLTIKFVGYNIKREIFKRRAALKNTRILTWVTTLSEKYLNVVPH
ncbi:hypothetical protein QE152_g26752 [Popillia japonica]|uniref:Uncharacterized protein n=1 Tax=Popillia japonica TaxID=7064 RepID=A0AAW1JYH3_POPJA